MNPITSLPIIQVNNLLHSPGGYKQSHKHHQSLNIKVPNPNKHISNKRQEQPNDSVQEPHSEPLSSKLHPRSLVEENKLVRIVTILKKHRHLPDNVVHRSGDAEEVDEDSA